MFKYLNIGLRELQAEEGGDSLKGVGTALDLTDAAYNAVHPASRSSGPQNLSIDFK